MCMSGGAHIKAPPLGCLFTPSQGIKVRISGRIGRKADMANIKEWQHGDFDMGTVSTHVDYGAAGAMTRLGMLGVWARVDTHGTGTAGAGLAGHVWTEQAVCLE